MTPYFSIKHTARLCVLTGLAAVTGFGAAAPGVINTFAGGGPNNAPAITANVDYPANTAVDTSGNFYIASLYQQRVFKVTSGGTLTVVAGDGTQTFKGDGQLATLAGLNNPQAIAVNSAGDIYIADASNCVIRKVTASTGLISTYAGTPQSCGFSGDGGPATSGKLYYPFGIALDSSGNLYIADQYNHRIRKVTAGGTISTIAGTGTAGFSGDGSAATGAKLYYPSGLGVDGAANVYIADSYNYRVRKITKSSGNISTIAGSGVSGYSGDGGPGPSAKISLVYGLTADSTGRVFIADTANCVIRQVSTGGTITTVAGNTTCGFSGDGSTATSGELYQPHGVAVDTANHIYIADYYNLRVRKATLGSAINTVAGNGTLTYYGTGVPANGAVLSNPDGVFADTHGNVFIADQSNCVVRKVDSSGTITIIAGSPGKCGYSGNGGAATSALLNSPVKAIADSAGNIYIADLSNCVVRKITASSGNIANYAGSASCGFSGDGGAATSAKVYYPYGLAIDSSNNLYIADTYNHRVRKVTSGGTISTFAGNGTAGFAGDSGSATNAELNYPWDVARDSSGNLYIADRNNHRIRVVGSNGVIGTFAGNGTGGYQGDGVVATETSLYYPNAVSVDVAGDLLISDYYNNRTRWVGGNGLIYSVAGTGVYGFLGDGSAASAAELAQTTGVAADPAGNIYIGDTGNNRIREVAAIPNINASGYTLQFGEVNVGGFRVPQDITLKGVGPSTISSITTSGDFVEGDDCPGTLGSNANCAIDVYFSPTAAGNRTGTLTINTNSFFAPTIKISLSGIGGGLTYAPASLNFGNQAVSTTSATQTFTFTNSSTSSISFSSVTTSKAVFAIASNTCTGSLAGGATCKIGVTFKPTALGLATGTLIVKDSDGTSPQLIPIRGTGIATSLSPVSLSFGTVVKGSTKALITTLSNRGTAGLTSIAKATSGTNAADFTTATNCGTTLAAGSSCTFTVTFKPSITGAESATLTITDNEGSFPVPLTGTGQ